MRSVKTSFANMSSFFQWLLVLVSIVTVSSVPLESSNQFIADSYSKDVAQRNIVKRALDDDEFIFRPEDFDVVPEDEIDSPSRIAALGPIKLKPGERHPTCYYNPTEEMESRLKKIQKNLRRVSDIQCEIYTWEYKIKVADDARYRDICLNNSVDHTTVYGGAEATQGDFPHMGAVGWRSGSDYEFKCGCSLISYKFALTAAHCSSFKENTPDTPELVRFGAVNLNDKNHEDYEIVRVRTMVKYRGNIKAYNDLGLIELKTEVTFLMDLRPACLYFVSGTEIQKGNVTGWGGTKKEKTSNNLLFAEIDILDRKTCDDNYEFKAAERWKSLHDSQFCAGKTDGSKDTCPGDSGGPIQIQRKFPNSMDPWAVNQYHVFGVTSVGAGCGMKEYPGIYNKVNDEHFLCWIEKIVWPNEENHYCLEDSTFEGYDYKKKN